MSNLSVLKIGIDVGSGLTKVTSSNGKQFAVESMAGIYPDTDAFGLDGASRVDFNGRSFLVGDSARNYLKASERYNTLTPDWSGCDGWMALMYYAIAYSMDFQPFKGRAFLATGVPQNLYGSLSRSLSEKMNGKHGFIVNGIPYQIDLEATIIPQAFSAAASYQGKVEQDDALGIIDIGTYTTGFSSVVDYQLVDHESGGTEIGMHTLYSDIQEYLKTQGITISDPRRIRGIVEKGFVQNKQVPLNIENVLTERKRAIAKELSDHISFYWGSASDRHILVAGGGALHFHEALREIYPHATLIENPFYAVSVGLFNLLESY